MKARERAPNSTLTLQVHLVGLQHGNLAHQLSLLLEERQHALLQGGVLRWGRAGALAVQLLQLLVNAVELQLHSLRPLL